MSIQAAIVQHYVLFWTFHGGKMTYLESTTKDPEKDGQIITRFCPLRSGNTDRQAVLRLARDVLDKYGAQKVTHNLGEQALVVTRGHEHLRTGRRRSCRIECAAEVRGQLLGWSEPEVSSRLVSIVDSTKLLNATADGADDCVGGGDDDCWGRCAVVDDR